MNKFTEFLQTTNIPKKDRDNLLYFQKGLSGSIHPKLAGRILAIHGDVGFGKSYLAQKLIDSVTVPVHYTGLARFKGSHVTRYKNLSALLSQAHKSTGLFCIDDINNVIEESEFGGYNYKDRRNLMDLMDMMRSKKNSGMMITGNNMIRLGSGITDRIDIALGLPTPNTQSKFAFLEHEYGILLSDQHKRSVARNSIGYNFRDLQRLIRNTAVLGKGKMSSQVIARAQKDFVPSGLECYSICKTDVNFNDVIGNERAKQYLQRTVRLSNDRALARKFGIVRSNLLVFHGPPGTGKTHLARALAGEIGRPFVTIKAAGLYRQNPLLEMNDIFSSARRFKDCVIFFDEAEKMIGRGYTEEDTPLQGELQSLLDGVQGTVDSIIIFAVNDLERFGEPIKDRFNCIEFVYPSEDERREFIQKKIKDAGKYMDCEMDLDEMVANSRNMSYRQIEKAWNEVAFKYLDTKEMVTTEDFIENLGGQESAREMFG